MAKHDETPREQHTEQQTFFSDLQLAKRYGVHRATIWRWVQKHNFPAPLKLSPGCARWRGRDVLEHEQAHEAK